MEIRREFGRKAAIQVSDYTPATAGDWDSYYFIFFVFFIYAVKHQGEVLQLVIRSHFQMLAKEEFLD